MQMCNKTRVVNAIRPLCKSTSLLLQPKHGSWGLDRNSVPGNLHAVSDGLSCPRSLDERSPKWQSFLVINVTVVNVLLEYFGAVKQSLCRIPHGVLISQP